MNYNEFLEKKSINVKGFGFSVNGELLNNNLFDFQEHIIKKALKAGRYAIFADCGLGKTLMELVFSEYIIRKENKPALILTPLAVSFQMVREGEKFGIECYRVDNGEFQNGINVTNYEQLHKYNPSDFSCVVCDESSILKSYSGTRRQEITEFMKRVKYRLLATATAAPNDFIELGTSSEALGNLGYIDMLDRYFKNDNNNVSLRRMYGEAPKWRFRGHAEIPFWRWVTSWSVACRKPSDLGFSNNGFILPGYEEKYHIIKNIEPQNGMLFNLPAARLDEQRKEIKRTIKERCEKVAELAESKEPVFVMCHLNDEGHLLKSIIPGAVEVSGLDSDEKKEQKLLSFLNGDSRVLITKPKIGAWGLNFQHCHHICYFPSHSYEAFYQTVRRCLRFGQKNKVKVDIVLTEGEQRIMENLKRKSGQANRMFDNLVAEMNNSQSNVKKNEFTKQEELPSWL